MTAPPLAVPTPLDRDPGRALRDTFGRFGTGVALITAEHRGRPVAMTVNSFTSVSLEPPLVLWCVHRESTRRRAFTEATHFAVNVLAADQRDLAVRFAGRGADLAGVAHQRSPLGPTVLTGAAAVLLCRREQTVPAGDHVVLLGAVVEHWHSTGAPLLFLDGTYQTG